MDRKLLDLLVCPATRQPLALLDKPGLEALNRAIAAGSVQRADDTPQTEPVREANVDILLVAMGSPAQEKWIDRHVGPGHARLVLSVGALFDFVAGEARRAPLGIRKLRLEWLYRLLQEPKRLWRRYVLGNPLFLYHVMRYKLSGMVVKRPTDETAEAGTR